MEAQVVSIRTEVRFINRGWLNFGGQIGFWQWIFGLRNAQAQLNFKLNFGVNFVSAVDFRYLGSIFIYENPPQIKQQMCCLI